LVKSRKIRARITSHKNERDPIIENMNGNTERYRNSDILHVHKLTVYLSTNLKAENSGTGGAYNIPYICVANYSPHSYSTEKLVMAVKLRGTVKR